MERSFTIECNQNKQKTVTSEDGVSHRSVGENLQSTLRELRGVV